MPGDDFRSCRLLLRKPILSTVTFGQRRGGERSPAPGWRAIPASRRTRTAGKRESGPESKSNNQRGSRVCADDDRRASIPNDSSKAIYLDWRTQPRWPPRCWCDGSSSAETGNADGGGCEHPTARSFDPRVDGGICPTACRSAAYCRAQDARVDGTDAGIRPPAALTPELTGADLGIQPPADPALIVGPKTPE
jgi:hypothetical protein